MKIMKKMTALLLALLMVMGMLVTTAMAAGEHTITITNAPAGHTYIAYQIFDGDVDGGIVSNIQWGNAIPEDKRDAVGTKDDDFILALKDDTILEEYFTAGAAQYKTASAIGDVIDGWSYNEDNIQAFAGVAKKFATENGVPGSPVGDNYEIPIAKPGYYLVMDNTSDDNSGDNIEKITDLLLMVSGSSAEIKHSVPTFEMSVNFRHDGSFHDAVDVEIDAPVYIKLEGTLPELYEDYRQYYLCYEVTLPEGMVFNLEDSNSDGQWDLSSFVENIYLLRGETVITLMNDIGEFSWEFDNSDRTLHFGFGDIHDEARATGGVDIETDDKLIVKLKAGLDPNAGDKLKFGKGGNTVDDLGNEIQGKMIYSSDMNELGTVPNNEHWNEVFNYAELKDTASVYTYQIKFQKQSSADHSKFLPDATFRLFRNVNGTDYYAEFVFDNGKNTGMIENWVTATDIPGSPDHTLLTSDSNGNFTVKGLDNQTYSLEEVTPPSGYNKMLQPVAITVASVLTGQDLTSLHAVVDSNTVQGVFENGLIATAPIYNTPGNALPTTGGIGTTIFYIVGGVLVLGAGAAFVMKRRNEET